MSWAYQRKIEEGGCPLDNPEDANTHLTKLRKHVSRVQLRDNNIKSYITDQCTNNFAEQFKVIIISFSYSV